jgi:hypothetical protein
MTASNDHNVEFEYLCDRSIYEEKNEKTLSLEVVILYT